MGLGIVEAHLSAHFAACSHCGRGVPEFERVADHITRSSAGGTIETLRYARSLSPAAFKWGFCISKIET